MMNNNQSRRGIGVFLLGQRYMAIWPKEQILGMIFPEVRICRYTGFAMKIMPLAVVVILSWQWLMQAQLSISVATALFALSLPLQGLWWLGKRAMSPLPASLLGWYHSVREKLATAGKVTATPVAPVTYYQLAELLGQAFRQLDDTFLDDL